MTIKLGRTWFSLLLAFALFAPASSTRTVKTEDLNSAVDGQINGNVRKDMRPTFGEDGGSLGERMLSHKSIPGAAKLKSLVNPGEAMFRKATAKKMSEKEKATQNLF
ncbi:uncharacterized protein PITG_23209 [Phytophthora infestans T30-4]|uniref:Secreted RxLR effector peptide protein n=1 Tax=Phytophthora infestans (strain T30-4) TaxID=403677 RepID=D0P460_PHYIT|nr:uncharacterized protein PITG_23209 [Phytophthora infestans T30-4]EEY63143.1 conserved hypothetical protein [Phytophthora infestans T30-4]|eukprot:XP_002894912.1 conserved hypothetical protein [Phytophthora infestans T30-4]